MNVMSDWRVWVVGWDRSEQGRNGRDYICLKFLQGPLCLSRTCRSELPARCETSLVTHSLDPKSTSLPR